jgi:hypothetical protein
MRPNTDNEILASQHFGDYPMKKTQMALAAVALVASTAAMANGVKVYGNLDAGLVSGKSATADGGTHFTQGEWSGNQWGLTGSEDLTLIEFLMSLSSAADVKEYCHPPLITIALLCIKRLYCAGTSHSIWAPR